MGSKIGRKNAYDEKIKPYFNEISEMCKTMTDKQIAEKLGIATSTFFRYKAEKKEFSELLKNGRQNLVAELKSILIKKATGFTYEERKIISDSTGFKRKEVIQRYSAPDVAAINLLLKNYDQENWSNDPQMLRLKQEEIKIKKASLKNDINGGEDVQEVRIIDDI